MTKRYRLILLTAPVAALSMGAWWWHRATPESRSAHIPFHGPDTLRDVYWMLTYEPKRAARLGYTDRQRKVDDAAYARSREPYTALRERIEAMRRRGITLEEAAAVYQRELPRAEAAAHALSSDLPSLTADQRARLLPEAIQWAGIWLLCDVGLAKKIGLSETQRRAFDEASDKVRQFELDENNASIRETMILDGAPPSAVLAFSDQMRLNAKVTATGLFATDPGISEAYNKLMGRTSYPTPSVRLTWVHTLCYDVSIRRSVAFRRSEEARLFATLTTEQQTRWRAFAKG